jgi:4'-phosphopantetheinyl transferase
MLTLSSWPSLADPPKLGQEEIHVWRVHVPDEKNVPPEWCTLLTQEETERVRRKRIPIDARRTLTSRACLRILLGGYLNIEPKDLKITTTEEGKPILDSQGPYAQIEFNVSHSGEWILFGFCHQRPLGIDIEYHRELEFKDIVHDLFAPVEKMSWNDLDPAEHSAAFFSAWTRKEAYVKAIGLGLLKPLDSFAVSIGPASAPELLWCAENFNSRKQWSIIDIKPAPGYFGALAIESIEKEVQTYHFQFN